MNDFVNIYAKLSDKELIEVLQNKANYNPEAIVVAQKEFEKRGLVLVAPEQDQTDQNHKKDIFESTISISKTIDVFKPIKSPEIAGDIFIKRIAFLVIAIAIYKIIRSYGSIDYMIHNTRKSNIEFAFVILNITFLPIVAYLLILKKKIAWYFIGIYSIKAIIYSVYNFHSYANYLVSSTQKFPLYFVTTSFVFLAIYILIISFLMKKSVRDEIGIINNDLVIFILLSIIYTGLFFIQT